MQPQPSVPTIADAYTREFGVALQNLIQVRGADDTMARMSREDAALLTALRDLNAARASHLGSARTSISACPTEAMREPFELIFLTAAEVATGQVLEHWRAIEAARLTAIGADLLARAERA